MATSKKPVETIVLALIVSAVLFFGTTAAVTITPAQAQEEGYTTEPYQAITVNNENIGTVVNQEPGAAAPVAEEEAPLVVEEEATSAAASEDLNCDDYTQRDFEIDPANDPSNLDADNDGVACETGTTEVTTEEAPAVAEEPAAAPVEETPIAGNAFNTIEQVAEFTAACFAEIEAAGLELIQGGLVLQDPAVEQAIEAEAEAAVVEAAPQVSNETVEVIQEEIIEITEAVNDTETQSAVEEQVNASEVAEEVVEGAIVEEIIEIEGSSEEVTEVITDAVEEVITGEATPEDAAGNMTEEIIEIVEEVEVTPEEVVEAAEAVNASEVITEAAADNSTLQVEVSDTVVESTEEVAAETGQSEQTVYDLLTEATELLAQAQHKLFGQE